MSDPCPTCGRSGRSDQLQARHRSGASRTERAAAEMMSVDELNRACRLVLEELIAADDWVPARRLRDVLDGGDGPRRARQLREDCGWPIESEMRTGPPRQAWYRIDPSVWQATLF